MTKAENSVQSKYGDARVALLDGDIAPGSNLAWPIANDLWPVRMIAHKAQGVDDNGRPGEVLQILVERQTRDGSVAYTKIQNVLRQFVFTRPTGMTAPLIDDKSIEQALAEHTQRFGEFLSTRATDSVVG